ncbi:hypothetical protein Tsubulata_014030 [Turnera subulata]|uniref:Cwf19-like C-terminal domain-containing protein n=1 Tax=Turnera subulata TaxID=218843 RepID=A0A9Q0JJ78_9ROSI|nr:hypothetical protein Tsubulata_014030 [Turnera subulata]
MCPSPTTSLRDCSANKGGGVAICEVRTAGPTAAEDRILSPAYHASFSSSLVNGDPPSDEPPERHHPPPSPSSHSQRKMLSGVKFISRDQIDEAQDDADDPSLERRQKSGRKKDKHKTRKKSYSSDDDLDKIKKGSRRNKKWYSSEEDSSEYSSESESEDNSPDRGKKKSKSRRKGKRDIRNRSEDEFSDGAKKKSRGSKKYYSEEFSSDESGKVSGKNRRNKSKDRRGGKKGATDDLSDDKEEPLSGNRIEIARKEMGLDWMLRPGEKTIREPAVTVDQQPEESPSEEHMKVNPRELNPYLKDNGSGYPDDTVEKRDDSNQLPSSSLVGDGGASWRLKALKRAQEQAARDGRNLDEVVEERWGSLGQLAASAASRAAAPSRAHLHAIKNRRRGVTGEQATADNQQKGDTEKGADREYLKDVSAGLPKMRAPRARDSLSWGKRKGQPMSAKDAGVISAAASSLNKFANDGNFMRTLLAQSGNDPVDSHANQKANVDKEPASESTKLNESNNLVKEGLSANQLAAKALQLRIKGKHEEAEKLMQEVDRIKAKQDAGENSSRPQTVGNISRYAVKDVSLRRKEEDADRHLAQKIMQNKQFSLSGRADDEYDFEDGPSKKSRKNDRSSDHKGFEKNNLAKRVLTQQERCSFCFENPNRSKHLVISIANFTYLMLPQWQPVVPGHCCILPMQHDSATRTVDNNVWEEIRNFKKCLIRMFAEQDKELVFLETVMGLAQQRRHCLIECVPLPREIAKEAPLYFKKAIDEAEDEWSQHNAKRLIDTSEKGLRGAIPKDFPYFHVEFGLNRGFVHVIDDETQFKSSLGLNVIRGMLHLPEEDMYRRRRQESAEVQKQAVADFARAWEPYDWTKELD